MRHCVFPTALGHAAIVWHEAGITGFQLPVDGAAACKATLVRRHRSEAAGEIPVWVGEIVERARRHFAGVPQDFSDARLDWSCVSGFQREVYRHTCLVKPGSTCSYGDIARHMGMPHASARAVGTALGNNPWPLLVPCHRVVSARGKMTGFSAPGGVRTKARLLALEGAELVLE